MSGLCLEFATLRYDMHSLALLLSFSLLNQTSLPLSFFLHRCLLLSFSLSLSLSFAISLSLSLCLMPLPHTPPPSLSGHLCVQLQANPGLHLSLPPRCTYVCVCVCVCVCMCVRVCVYMHMYACECVCMYTHTHTHTHIYICRERDNVVYWKTKRKINDDLQCN